MNQVGKCSVIRNCEGHLTNVYAGLFSHIALEPIEKRPLYHFRPGTKFLSVGFSGCNFICQYCQNFRVSQQIPSHLKRYAPKEMVDLAESKSAAGIAFTYNEPTLFYEYIIEVGKEIFARKSALSLVLKSNGFVNLPVLESLADFVDGVNIDIKGNNADYQEVCGGSLDPVVESLKFLVGKEVHVEVSYLVLPQRIKDHEFNIWLRDLVAQIQVPLHLLFFYPFHKMIVPSYGISDLIGLADFFSQKVQYVYIPNHFDSASARWKNTYCPVCCEALIERQKSVVVRRNSCCIMDHARPIFFRSSP